MEPVPSLYPDLYKSIYGTLTPQEDAPPASFQEPADPEIKGVRSAKSNWHVLSNDAVANEQRIITAQRHSLQKWTLATLVSGSASGLVYFKGRFAPIVTLATFAGLTVLTIALSIKTLLVSRRPQEAPWAQQKAEAGNKLNENSDWALTEIQRQFKTLIDKGILTDQDINELVAPQIDTLTYEQFIAKRGESILPIIAKDPSNKAILRQKALIYFSSSKMGILQILGTQAARHLGITLQDIGPFVAGKEADNAKDYAAFSARNGSDALEYLLPYPNRMKKMSESFLTLPYTEMMSPAKEADRKRFGITDATLKGVMIQRWNKMTIQDILKNQRADFDLAVRKGLVVPQEWTMKILIETQWMKVTEILDLYPDFIEKGFLTAASCFPLNPAPDFLPRGHTCPTHSPTLAQRMSAQLQEFTTLQSVPHLKTLLAKELIHASHPHLASLVTQYLRTDTRNYLLKGHATIDQYNLIPTDHSLSVATAKADWKSENSLYSGKLGTLQADKKAKIQRADKKRDEKLTEAKTDLKVEVLQERMKTRQAELKTAQTNEKSASDANTAAQASLQANEKRQAELNGRMEAEQKEFAELQGYADDVQLNRLNAQVSNADHEVIRLNGQLEAQVKDLKQDVYRLEKLSKEAQDVYTKVHEKLTTRQKEASNLALRVVELEAGLTREARLKAYDKQIGELEAEIQAPAHKEDLKKIQEEIAEYSKKPEGVPEAWKEAKTGARAAKVKALEAEKAKLNAKPALLEKLKKERKELLEIQIPSATEMARWEEEVKEPKQAAESAKAAYDAKVAEFDKETKGLRALYKIAEKETTLKELKEKRDTYAKHHARHLELIKSVSVYSSNQRFYRVQVYDGIESVRQSASALEQAQKDLTAAEIALRLAQTELTTAETDLAKKSNQIWAEHTDAVKDINNSNQQAVQDESNRHETALTKVVQDLQARIPLPVQQRG